MATRRRRAKKRKSNLTLWLFLAALIAVGIAMLVGRSGTSMPTFAVSSSGVGGVVLVVFLIVTMLLLLGLIGARRR